MKTLKNGSYGPQVQLLQLALIRAGFPPEGLDGIFGTRTQQAVRRFQTANRLTVDGVVGQQTHTALYPYYAGYISHTIRPNDTLYKIALANGSSLRAIEIANPYVNPLQLTIGSTLIVPLSFPVVPTNIDYCSALITFCVRGLAARYPFLALDELGKSVMGRPLYALSLGSGTNRVFYNASHHANEWITTPLLLHFCEELAAAAAFGKQLYGFSAQSLLDHTRLCIAPAINMDGIDLVTGDLVSGPYYDRARDISRGYPSISFPAGWKANILGTDLNLQYPAGWSQAREIKYAQGYTSPAPRDFVGLAPLSAPESRSVYEFTLNYSPALTLSYHTQGKTIYWKYLDYEPQNSQMIAHRFAAVSGYTVQETPFSSGFAGYKDWFIQNYNRPGYTIEAGLGANPLPISQFQEIYDANIGILTLAMLAAVGTE